MTNSLGVGAKGGMSQAYRLKGTIMAVGGKEDLSGERTVLKEFVRIAGGSRARLAIMTVATTHPRQSAHEYAEVFEDLGVRSVGTLDITNRSGTMSPENVATIDRADGVWFTGGDQLFITSLLGGSLVHAALVRLLGRDRILGGTSAGAAMLSNSMILRGESDAPPQFGGTEIGPGMDFVPGTIIDTHFAERGRHGRLLTAVAHYPQGLGIGIDEDTALVIERGMFRVIGRGSVTVIDAARSSMTNLPGLDRGGNLALHDVLVHVLPRGFRYDLNKRRPITEISHTRVRTSRVEESGGSGKPRQRRKRSTVKKL